MSQHILSRSSIARPTPSHSPSIDRNAQNAVKVDLSLSAPDSLFQPMPSADFCDTSSSFVPAEHGVSPVINVLRSSYPPSPSQFITVVPPSDYPFPPQTSQAEKARLQRGSLLPLYPTLRGQLWAISREYSLPAVSGLTVYLVEDGNGGPGPKVGESSWSALWGRYFPSDNYHSPQSMHDPFASTRRSSEHIVRPRPDPSSSNLDCLNPSSSTIGESTSNKPSITYLNSRRPSARTDNFAAYKSHSVNASVSTHPLPILAKIEWAVEESKAPWWPAWTESRISANEHRAASHRRSIILNQESIQPPFKNTSPSRPSAHEAVWDITNVKPAQASLQGREPLVVTDRHSARQARDRSATSSRRSSMRALHPLPEPDATHQECSVPQHLAEQDSSREKFDTASEQGSSSPSRGQVSSQMAVAPATRDDSPLLSPTRKTPLAPSVVTTPKREINLLSDQLRRTDMEDAEPPFSPQTAAGGIHTGYSDFLEDDEEQGRRLLSLIEAVPSTAFPADHDEDHTLVTEPTQLEVVPELSDEDLWKDLHAPAVPFRSYPSVERLPRQQPLTATQHNEFTFSALDGFSHTRSPVGALVPDIGFSPPRSTTSRIQSWIGKTPRAATTVAQRPDGVSALADSTMDNYVGSESDVDEVVGLWSSNIRNGPNGVPLIDAPSITRPDRNSLLLGLGLPIDDSDLGQVKEALLSPINLDLATFGEDQPNLHAAKASVGPHLLHPYSPRGAFSMPQTTSIQHLEQQQSLKSPGALTSLDIRLISDSQRSSKDLSETLDKMERALQLLSPDCSPNPGISPVLSAHKMSSRESLAYARSLSASVTPSPKWLTHSKATSSKSRSQARQTFVAGDSPSVRSHVSPRPASTSVVSMSRSSDPEFHIPPSATRLAELSWAVSSHAHPDSLPRHVEPLDDSEEIAKAAKDADKSGAETGRSPQAVDGTGTVNVELSKQMFEFSDETCQANGYVMAPKCREERLMPADEVNFTDNDAVDETQRASGTDNFSVNWDEAGKRFNTQPLSVAVTDRTITKERWGQASHLTRDSLSIPFSRSLRSLTAELEDILEIPVSDRNARSDIDTDSRDRLDPSCNAEPETWKNLQQVPSPTTPEHQTFFDVHNHAAHTGQEYENLEGDHILESAPPNATPVLTTSSTPAASSLFPPSPMQGEHGATVEHAGYLHDYSFGADEIRAMNEQTRAAVKDALSQASHRHVEPSSAPLSSKGSTSPSSSMSASSLFGAYPIRRNASSGSLSSLTHDMSSIHTTVKKRPARLDLETDSLVQSSPDSGAARRLPSTSPNARFRQLPPSPSVHSIYKTLASSPLSATFPNLSSPQLGSPRRTDVLPSSSSALFTGE